MLAGASLSAEAGPGQGGQGRAPEAALGEDGRWAGKPLLWSYPPPALTKKGSFTATGASGGCPMALGGGPCLPERRLEDCLL